MKTRRSEWWVPAGLVGLSLVPVGAGMVRLGKLPGGSAVPMALHIAAITLFSLLGAFQFAPSLRRFAWHRASGRVVVAAGLVAAASGLWMTQFSAPANQGGALYALRLAVGVWMIAALVQGTRAILRRDVPSHQDWMLRGYAIGMGAGTQLFTNLPWVALVGPPSAGVYAVLMGAGWAINFAVAEWIIHQRRPIPAARAGALPATGRWA